MLWSQEINIATTSETLQLWHERLGHQDKHYMRKVLEWMEINISMAETGGFCDGYVLGKHIGSLSLHGWINHWSSVSWSMPMLMDQCQWSRFEEQRAVFFNADYSKYCRVFFIKQKQEGSNVYTCAWMKCRLLATEQRCSNVMVARSPHVRKFIVSSVTVVLSCSCWCCMRVNRTELQNANTIRL